MKKIQQQRGVALVITLIMLSVITFLAVAFLALSRRERAAMATSSNQTDSRLAADFAFARAQSEIIARIITETNMLVGDMMVSRAFINTNGFRPSNTDVTNVNYFTNVLNGPLSAADHIQNVANLYYDPQTVQVTFVTIMTSTVMVVTTRMDRCSQSTIKDCKLERIGSISLAIRCG